MERKKEEQTRQSLVERDVENIISTVDCGHMQTLTEQARVHYITPHDLQSKYMHKQVPWKTLSTCLHTSKSIHQILYYIYDSHVDFLRFFLYTYTGTCKELNPLSMVKVFLSFFPFFFSSSEHQINVFPWIIPWSWEAAGVHACVIFVDSVFSELFEVKLNIRNFPQGS